MNLQVPIRAHAMLSDRGRKRKRNEDALMVIPGWGVYCVCDGIGGVEGGKEASGMVVFAIDEVFRNPPMAAAMVAHAYRVLVMSQAIREAGRRIHAAAKARGVEGMGSTVTTLLFDQMGSGRATLLHAGDSLAFRMRGERMERLAEPHVVEASLERENHEDLQLGLWLSRAVGIDMDMRLEPTPVDVQTDDIFLLCTDGLTNHVQPEELAEHLWRCRPDGPETVVRRLIDLANERGGRDNITAIVIECD